jgi:spermidine/putrescine transport system permease protein
MNALFARLRKRLLTGYSLLFFFFVYAPILLIVGYSFNSNPINMMVWNSFTLDWYRSIFGLTTRLGESALYVESTDQLLAAMRTSLVVALTTTLFSTLVGTLTALAIARYRFRLQGFYRFLLFMPMVMPDIVLGIALLIFFVSVGMPLGTMSIILGHCTFLISYVFIIVSARLAGMDTQLEEASADLGAGPWTTFRRITLPLIAPGIAGGAMLAFIISMDDLVITYFISGVDSTTLPVFIYSMIRRGIKPEINAIATLLLLASFVIAAGGLYLRSRQSTATPAAPDKDANDD